ncbi:hypothetical protein JCM3765_003566 [Sporobolomyces pararoseus]
MLSSLPPELLHQIIESTVPHTFHIETYDDRQQTLCSLSLVSKQFCTLAQPLLYEMVWIKSRDSLERYKTTIGSFGESDGEAKKMWRPKAAVIESKVYSGPAKMTQEAMSKEVVQLFSSVKSLMWNLNSIRVENLPSLTGFSNLSTLHLSSFYRDFGIVPSLPQLQSLSMSMVGSSIMDSLLDPKVVPNLKHFSLVGTSAACVRRLKRSLLEQLFARLLTLTFDIYLWLDEGPELGFLRSAASRALVVSCFDHFDEAIPLEAQIVHLCILDLELYPEDKISQTLDKLGSSLQSAHSLLLQSLYLHCSLQPSSSGSAEVSKSVRKLIDICEKRNIEVGFEMSPGNPRLDPWFSEEFIRRQRARRNQEAEGKVEK